MFAVAVEDLTHRVDVRAAFPKRLLENRGDWRKRLSREDCVRAASLTANDVKLFTKCQQMRLYGGDSHHVAGECGPLVSPSAVLLSPAQQLRRDWPVAVPDATREPTHCDGARNGDGEGEPVS